MPRAHHLDSGHTAGTLDVLGALVPAPRAIGGAALEELHETWGAPRSPRALPTSEVGGMAPMGPAWPILFWVCCSFYFIPPPIRDHQQPNPPNEPPDPPTIQAEDLASWNNGET